MQEDDKISVFLIKDAYSLSLILSLMNYVLGVSFMCEIGLINLFCLRFIDWRKLLLSF